LQKQRRQQASHGTNNPNALPPSVRFHLCLCCIVAAAAFRAAQSWGKLYRYLFATVNDSSHIFV
jgi:hypothetical protein